VSSVSLFENLTSRGVGGSEELSELSVLEGSVAIGVDSADDGEQLALGGVVAGAAEEGAKVECADAAIVVLVN
jgi:hypothetical protein